MAFMQWKELQKTVFLSLGISSLCIIFFSKSFHTDHSSIIASSRILSLVSGRNWSLYDEIQCLTLQKVQSNKFCSFSMLNDYHRMCARFAGLTWWQNDTEKSGGWVGSKAVLKTTMCQLKSLDKAPQALFTYITNRNITRIAVFGDSQGVRYSTALVALFEEAAFKCKLIAQEPQGTSRKDVYGSFYTRAWNTWQITTPVKRRCANSCPSTHHTCSHPKGHKVRLEYLSMELTTQTEITLCTSNKTFQGCANMTQEEFIFKRYFQKKYPQLIMFFTTFLHDKFRTLNNIHRGLVHLLQQISSNAPPSSSIIWYSTTPYHVKNALKKSITRMRKIKTLNHFVPNEKVRVENDIFSKLLQQQLATGHTQAKSHTRVKGHTKLIGPAEVTSHSKVTDLSTKPRMYSFFDLYHIQEELMERWSDGDDVCHSQPYWYNIIIGYTATLLPTLYP